MPAALSVFEKVLDIGMAEIIALPARETAWNHSSPGDRPGDATRVDEVEFCRVGVPSHPPPFLTPEGSLWPVVAPTTEELQAQR